MTEQPAPPARRRTRVWVLLLLAIIPAAAIAWVLYLTQVRRPLQDTQARNSELVYNVLGLGDPAPLQLDRRFVDSNGDLVADRPADPAHYVDPPTLTFSYVATYDPEEYRARFKEFVEHLSQQVGRPVEYALYHPDEELQAMREGKLHVAGINTGNIPVAVNECGFVPVCSAATEQGASSYRMQIIVPADSPIRHLSQLKGSELTLTEPGSNSGFKAPLVLLSRDKGLQPGRDFSIRYSQGHRESIAGIANKTYRAAAVASDVLQRALGEEQPIITKDQFRVIYESEPFPAAGFGYVCTLKPELAEKVRQAFFGFEWKGTGVEKEFAAAAQTKFVPVSYEKDFALVRRIDNEIRSIRSAGGIPDAAEPTTEPVVTR